MALLPRLRQLMRRPSSASRVGARRPTKAARRGDTLHEDALRSMLSDDPNNERAFVALAEIVRRRAAEASPDHDPLAAETTDTERQRAADLAVWALGEELAGQPARLVPAHRGRPPVGARRPRGHAAPADHGRRAGPVGQGAGRGPRPPARGRPAGGRARARRRPLAARASTTRRSPASWCSPPSRPAGRSRPSSTSPRSTCTRTSGRSPTSRASSARDVAHAEQTIPGT